MVRYRWHDGTSKFEEQVVKEAEEWWEGHKKAKTHAFWTHSKPPKHQQKRAPLWIERTRGHTSICRVCVERIKKDTIRFATNSPNAYGWQAYYWHPYCYTSQILKELAYAEELEDD